MTALPPDDASSRAPCFHTTRWSVVRVAGEDDAGAVDPDRAQAALEALCRSYWPPVYAFLRRGGLDGEAAEERTQAFFCMLLERNLVARADASRGRFRSFLLGCLRHFSAEAQRRQARSRQVPFDAELAQQADEVTAADSPEAAFDRSWAQLVLDRALGSVERAYAERGEAEVFAALRVCLSGAPAGGYGPLAEQLGRSTNAVRVASHRLRTALRAELEREVRETLAEPDLVPGEIQTLLGALSLPGSRQEN